MSDLPTSETPTPEPAQTAAEPRPTRARKSRLRRAGVIALMATTALGLVLGGAWLNRRVLAREALVGWLDQRGIPASVRVDRIELDGFVGQIIVGDAKDPDFSGDVEVDYRVFAPWSATGLGVTPSRVRLIRPVLKAGWGEDGLSLGSLDPLVEEFTGKPPRPDSRSPLIIVEQGRVNLTTDYGLVSALADLTLDNGKLMRLKASTRDVALKQGERALAGLSGHLDLTTRGDRITLNADLGAASLISPEVGARAARIRIVGDLPYPDLKTLPGATARGVDSRASLDLALTGEALTLAGVAAASPDVTARFRGVTTGWIETFRIAGDLTAKAEARSLSGDGLSASAPRLDLSASRIDLSRRDLGELNWAVRGPALFRAATASSGELDFNGLTLSGEALEFGGRGAALEATGPIALTAARASFGELALTGARGRADLDIVRDNGALLIQASGALNSSGGQWPLFGPRAADDLPELTAMKAALGDFGVEIPAFRFTSGSAGTRMTLTAPARLTPRNGGVLTVQPVDGPVFVASPGELGGGALTLSATRGEGLPEAAFDIPRWSLTPGGFSADLDGRAALDFGLARGLTVTTAGTLAMDGEVLTYRAARCLDIAVERLELDENDVFDVSGQACPVAAPLAWVSNGRWRADMALTDFAARAPFLEMDFEQIEGLAAVTGAPQGLGLTATVASSRIRDAAEAKRFHPLIASGAIRLADENWSGGFDLNSPAHPTVRVARLAIDHDGRSQTGGVDVQTGSLSFVPEGLQPANLTPMVDGLVNSPVSGSVEFNGRIAWDPALPEGSSSGRLIVPGLDFTTPAGTLQGLKGTVEFSSLVPLVTAPGQALTVDRLDTITALTDLDLRFSLDAAALEVGGGEIKAAGGFIRIEPLSVPLDRTAVINGVIVLDRVQLGQLIADAGLAERVSLDAVVSGRLPFAYDPKTGFKVAGGLLEAVQPGRLSIDRDALTDLEAAGGGDEIPPSTVEDLAYQAMENLAFETLSATVDSEDGGRLSLSFSVKGRHDPPEHQELRVTVPDLISRRFLHRHLALPSDTGIDLTLATSLNINELISDILAYNQNRNGEVDPVTAPEPDPES